MSKLRILMVEDNPLNRQLARDVLEVRGHEVTVAVDVDGARHQLERGTYDIVLIDIQIPGGGGEAVLKHMRERDNLKKLPALAVTAYAMAGDKERLLAAGFDGYIGKPIDTKSFGATVETFAETSSPGDQSNG